MIRKKVKVKKSKMLYFRVTKKLDVAIRKKAKQLNYHYSDLIREILEEWLR